MTTKKMTNGTFWNAAALTAGALLGGTLTAHADAATPPQQTPTQAQPAAPNPAIAKFGADVTFYASFDNSAVADLSNGDGQPVDVKSPIKLQSGLCGNAFLAGQGEQRFFYQEKDNIDLTRPGAVAVWISPQEWMRDTDKIPTFPIFSASDSDQWLLLARQGNKANREELYAFSQVGGSKSDKKAFAASGNSLEWKAGEWHLLVCNWDNDSIAFSLDGATPHTAKALWRAEAKGEPGKFYIGTSSNYSDPEIRQPYLVDELLIFSRPLKPNEIKWMYQSLKPAQN